MANRSYSKTSGNTTVKQRNTYSTPSSNSAKISTKKPVNMQIKQTTNVPSNNNINIKIKRGTNAQITQRGTGNNRIAMSVPRGTTIKVRGKSKVKVG